MKSSANFRLGFPTKPDLQIKIILHMLENATAKLRKYSSFERSVKPLYDEQFLKTKFVILI